MYAFYICLLKYKASERNSQENIINGCFSFTSQCSFRIFLLIGIIQSEKITTMTQLFEYYIITKKLYISLQEQVTTPLRYISLERHFNEKLLIILRKRNMKLQQTNFIFFKCTTKKLQETYQNGGMSLWQQNHGSFFFSLLRFSLSFIFFQQAHLFYSKQNPLLETSQLDFYTGLYFPIQPMMQLKKQGSHYPLRS